jgi:hypothetical protein
MAVSNENIYRECQIAGLNQLKQCNTETVLYTKDIYIAISGLSEFAIWMSRTYQCKYYAGCVILPTPTTNAYVYANRLIKQLKQHNIHGYIIEKPSGLFGMVKKLLVS